MQAEWGVRDDVWELSPDFAGGDAEVELSVGRKPRKLAGTNAS